MAGHGEAVFSAPCFFTISFPGENMYIRRATEDTALKHTKSFRVVLATGPCRQARGITTHMAYSGTLVFLCACWFWIGSTGMSRAAKQRRLE
jgi:hypothetical protein